MTEPTVEPSPYEKFMKEAEDIKKEVRADYLDLMLPSERDRIIVLGLAQCLARVERRTLEAVEADTKELVEALEGVEADIIESARTYDWGFSSETIEKMKSALKKAKRKA